MKKILETDRSIGLSILRFLLCLLVIRNFIKFMPYADILFGPDGIARTDVYGRNMRLLGLEWLAYPFEGFWSPQLFLWAGIVVSLLFMLGIGRRITGTVLFIMIIILQWRNYKILDGSDNVIQTVLPWLVLADSYRYFAYKMPRLWPAKWSLPKGIYQHLMGLAVLGLMVQVSYVYFFTMIPKLDADDWVNGTALFYVMRLEEFEVTRWNVPLTQNVWFVVLGTYFTLLFEIAFPCLVWFRQTRPWVLLAGFGFHMGIWIFMRIDVFPFIMIATYFVFFSNEEYMQAWAWGKKQRYIGPWLIKLEGMLDKPAEEKEEEAPTPELVNH